MDIVKSTLIDFDQPPTSVYNVYM